MRKVVLFPHPRSRFDVLSVMTHDLQQALIRQGVEAVLCDVSNTSPEALYETVRSENPDCTWSINFFVDESWFYEPLGIPHVFLGVDGFTRYPPALLSFHNTVQLFVDRVTADLFSKQGQSPALWFPHAISCDTISAMRASVVPLEKRPYDVVFLGSFIDEEKELSLWRSFFSFHDVEALKALSEQALEDPSFTLFPAVLAMIESSSAIRSCLIENEVTPNDLANSVENYIRGCDRRRLLAALEGRTVHLFTTSEGASVASRRTSYKNCVLHPSVPFHEVLDICSQARVVINSSPSIRNGYHERLLLGLASGAVVVTSASRVLPTWLEEAGAVVSYTTSSLPSLSHRLAAAEGRAHPQKNILDWLEENHTWDVRLKEHLPHITKQVWLSRAEWCGKEDEKQ